MTEFLSMDERTKRSAKLIILLDICETLNAGQMSEEEYTSLFIGEMHRRTGETPEDCYRILKLLKGS